jgi:hypothetical protein
LISGRVRREIGEKWGRSSSLRCVLLPGTGIKPAVPIAEGTAELFVEDARPYLEQQVGATKTPAYLLAFSLISEGIFCDQTLLKAH